MLKILVSLNPILETIFSPLNRIGSDHLISLDLAGRIPPLGAFVPKCSVLAG